MTSRATTQSPRAYDRLNLQRSQIWTRLQPATAGEIAAMTPVGVTIDESYPRNHAFRYGVEYDDTNDQSAKILAWFSLLQNRDVAYFPPTTDGKRLVFEPASKDPNLGTGGNQCGVVISGKNHVHIVGDGVTIKSTTNDNPLLGVFNFYNCNHCSARGFKLEGSHVEGGTPAWTMSLYSIQGNCDNVDVDGSIDGGYSLCYVTNRTLAYTGTDADEPKHCKVTGYATNTRHSLEYVATGAGQVAELRGTNNTRTLYVENCKQLAARLNVTPSNTGIETEQILLKCSGGGSVENITLDLNVDTGGHNGLVLSDTSGIGTYRNIKARGILKGGGSGGVVRFATTTSTSTLFERIDLEELHVESESPSCVQVAPDRAYTIRGLTFPRSAYSSGTDHALALDNTQGATIRGVRFPSGRIKMTHSGSYACINCTGGSVTDVEVGDVICDSDTTYTNAIVISNATNLAIGKCILPSTQPIFVSGSKNVRPFVNGINGSFVLRGTIANSGNYNAVEAVQVTSGTPTVSALSRMIPGQRITFYFDGGTPTFQAGANMRLSGGANFIATQYDTITLVCIDDPANGPLATSTMAEVCRSVNA